MDISITRAREENMMKHMRFFLGGMMLTVTAFVLIASDASAQNIDKFTVTGEMAKKAMVKGEISVATAEKL